MLRTSEEMGTARAGGSGLRDPTFSPTHPKNKAFSSPKEAQLASELIPLAPVR